MGKSTGSAPAAPDPVKTSQAQADAYIKSAREASKLNNLAQYTPYGQITFDKDSEGVPIAQRVSLNPGQQAALDAQTQLQGSLSSAAAGLASNVPTGAFGLPIGMPDYTTGLDLTGMPDYMKSIDFSKVPDAADASDFGAQRDSYAKDMFDRSMSLLRPEFETQTRRTRQMLSDRGLPDTGEAYTTEMNRIDRGQNDAMLNAARDATIAGAGEQSRLYGLKADARNRAVGEQLQQGQVAQAARAGATSEEAQNAQLAAAARQAMTNEALLEYNAPAQAIATLLGASPKTPAVQGGNIYQSGVGTPDVQGNIWNSYNAAMANYQNKQQQSNAMWSGIGNIVGSVGGALMMSDENMKEDIGPADSPILEAVENIPISSWRYKPEAGQDDGQKHVGPMAQDFKGFFGLGDGRTIPVVDAMGINMKATQDLARKVRQLEARI